MPSENKAAPLQTAEPTVKFTEENRLARVHLSHTARRNAITGEMRERLISSYRNWVKDPHIYAILIESEDPNFFSAGADIREVHQAMQQGGNAARDIFQAEYETIWAMECYTKPLIYMVNGSVMGGGVGIAQHGTHMIAGENFSWSMPEVKIGLFPDVGITHLFAKMPAAIGVYLGLTGRAIDRSDAVYLDLVEHCINSTEFETIRTHFRDADPVDAVLDGLHQAPPPSELETLAPVIAKTFGQPSVEAIFTALEEIEDENKAWAEATLAELKQASPLSLKVTFEAIKRASEMSTEQTLAQDYTLVQHFLKNSDFKEGATAKLIEKRAPRWAAADPKEISEATVAAFFKDPGTSQLNLPPRELGVDK